MLLDEVGMTPAFMTSQLCWMGESYKLHLHDTLILQHKQVDDLRKESDKVMGLLGGNRNILPNIVPVDDENGRILIFFFFFFYMLASHNGIVK